LGNGLFFNKLGEISPKRFAQNHLCLPQVVLGVFQSQYLENITTHTKMSIFGEKKGLTLRGEFFFFEIAIFREQVLACRQNIA
jgi:hypothetical protein